MFNQVRKKLLLFIDGFFVVFIIILTSSSTIIISNSINDNFERYAKDAVGLSIKNFDNFLDLNTANAKEFTQTEDLIEKLDNHELSLNVLRLASVFVLNVYVYYGDTIYTSANVSDPIKLEELMTDEYIKDNMENANVSEFFSVRTSNIKAYIGTSLYDPSYGIITFFKKIYKDNEYIGVLACDYDPRFLYNKFLSFSDYQDYKDTVNFIVANDSTYVKAPFNKEDLSSYLVEDNYSSDNRFIIYRNEIPILKTNLVSLIPTKRKNDLVLSTIWPILLTSFILLTGAIVMGGILSKKISNDLEMLNKELNDKKNQMLDSYK